jgi:hypothetical protein
MRGLIIAGVLFAIGFGVTELIASSLEPTAHRPDLNGMPEQVGSAFPAAQPAGMPDGRAAPGPAANE